MTILTNWFLFFLTVWFSHSKSITDKAQWSDAKFTQTQTQQSFASLTICKNSDLMRYSCACTNTKATQLWQASLTICKNSDLMRYSCACTNTKATQLWQASLTICKNSDLMRYSCACTNTKATQLWQASLTICKNSGWMQYLHKHKRNKALQVWPISNESAHSSSIKSMFTWDWWFVISFAPFHKSYSDIWYENITMRVKIVIVIRLWDSNLIFQWHLQ